MYNLLIQHTTYISNNTYLCMLDWLRVVISSHATCNFIKYKLDDYRAVICCYLLNR